MSNILVNNVVGTGIYEIPATNNALDAASAGFAAILIGVTGLGFADVLAWVRDSAPSGGGEGTRILCCYIRTYEMGGSICPSEAATDVLFSDIKQQLELDENIVSIGDIYAENMSSWGG